MVDLRESPGTLYRFGKPARTPDLSVLVRPIERSDLEWVHRLFKQRYPQDYCWHTTDVWFCHTVLNNPLSIYAARTDDAFVLANTTVMPWIPGKYECHIVTICSDENASASTTWQVMKLLRASIDWARARKCYVWKISSDMEIDVTPLAQRLGAKQLLTRFALQLIE